MGHVAPPRLLYLAPNAPRLDATHGGARVTGELLVALGRRHPVALIYMRGDDEPPVDGVVRRQCDVVVEVRRPGATGATAGRWLRHARLVAALLQARPMWVSDWACKEFYERVRDVGEAWQPDVVHLEQHVMAQYLPALKNCSAPRVLVEYEPGVRAAPYLKRSLPVFGNLFHTLDQVAWRRYERAAIKAVQTVVVLTERDRQALESLAPNVPIRTIGLGTVLPDRPLSPRGQPPASLVFVGNFLHPPNLDAARRLVNVIYPAVRALHPETELYVVGDRPPPDLVRRGGRGVFVTGRVPDVRPYLDRAALVVAPLRLGGGMRVKVLEAVAAGKAVVTSRLAVEGLNLIDGEHIVLAESDEEFVARVAELLGHAGHRVALAERARVWARANLGWEGPVTAYEALYDALMSRAENPCPIPS